MSSLHSECCDDFEFFGEWDAESFMRLVEEAREKDEDNETNILDILGEIRHDDVDKASASNTLAEYVYITMKNSAAVMGIKRLSSQGTGRLSAIAVKRARGRPTHPTNRQEGREKMRNAKEPSIVLHRL